MGGLGSVMNMHVRMKQNRAITTSNKQKIRSNKWEVAHFDKDTR